MGSKRYQCILLCTISSFLRRSHNRMSQEYWYTLRFRDSHSMMWDTRRDLRKNQQYHWYQRIQYYNYKKMILRLTMVQKWLKNPLGAMVQCYRVHPESNPPRIYIRVYSILRINVPGNRYLKPSYWCMLRFHRSCELQWYIRQHQRKLQKHQPQTRFHMLKYF